MNYNCKLRENYLLDLKKKEINKFERAEMIRNMMTDKNLSIREFALKYNINKSTIEDWLLYERISESEFQAHKKNGFSTTEIYRMLRETKNRNLDKHSALDTYIQLLTTKLNKGLAVTSHSEKTTELIDLLEKAINTYKYRLEKKKGIRL